MPPPPLSASVGTLARGAFRCDTDELAKLAVIFVYFLKLPDNILGEGVQ